ncbi:MAG: sulfatase family protein [Planctomycetota bacterium]|jgi:arylsulfatase A-like enzyme
MGDRQPNGRPNILYVMSDDHASNAISCYGSRLASVFKTPSIDRIANEGVRLMNCHCTNSICTPSRATILTGQHSHVNGVYTLADPLDPTKETLATLLKGAGYATAVIGKWHLKTEPQGFDHYDVLPGQGKYFDPVFRVKGQLGGVPFEECPGTRREGYVSDIIADRVLEWLDGRDRTKPFFLMYHNKAPHDMFDYHERFEHMFDGIEVPEPDSLFEDKSHRSPGTREYGTTVSPTNARRNYVKHFSHPKHPTGTVDFSGMDFVQRTKAAYQKYLKDYLRCCAGIDDNLGRVLDRLDAEGIAGDTIVVYTSDQGMMLGEHDYIDKRWIFEESLRMPFVVRYPREVPAGTVNDDIVTNVDFAPWLLDLAGVDVPAWMQGKSFRANLRGETPGDWQRSLYYRYWMHMAHHDVPAHYGVRTKTHKLVFYYGLDLGASGAHDEASTPGLELYDLEKDPFELKNVYDDPAYADVVRELKAELLRLKDELGDPDEPYPEVMKLREEMW